MYEHAPDDQHTDTLEIIAELDSIPGQPIRDTVLGAGIGVRSFPNQVLFADSTLVRNSGDFQHVLVGEGGNVSYARAVTYDARRGTGPHVNLGTGTCKIGLLQLNCTGTADSAVSTPAFVGQFVVNRSSSVSSIATNFNGRTNLVRADSIYAFDFILRQTGLMQISGQAVGMDFFPLNDFDAQSRTSGGTKCASYKDCRLVFAARPDSSIDVFDTYFYGRVTDTTTGAGASIPIPVRDGLVGPVRVAAVGANTVMFGITANGLVVIQLPTVHNSLFPTPPRPAPSAPRTLRASVAPLRR
jgi:hypothetical protein